MNTRSSISYQHVPYTYEISQNYQGRSGSIFDMSFRGLTVGTALLPLVGFLFCVLWSLLVQFDKTTATHCNVPNLLPSLSAATGAFMPQKAVWKASISLHTVPRIVVFVAYFTKHRSGFVFLLNFIEVISLLGLALFGSNENYSIHSKCFGTFLITSLCYMFLVSYTNLHSWCRRTVRVKTMIAWINLFMMISATYFFFRHNSHSYYDLGNLYFAIISDGRKESQMSWEIA